MPLEELMQQQRRNESPRVRTSKTNRTKMSASNGYGLLKSGDVDASPGKGLVEIVIAANADGMDLLRRGQAAMAFEQLKFAEAVLVANPEVAKEQSSVLALTC